MILVEKKANYACFHIHTEAVSTWSHARHVEKNGYATSNRRQKWLQPQKPTQTSSRVVAPLKCPHPHKE